MQLVLLAAGKGSRLPKKYRNSPKCMVKINNKTILDHNKYFYNKFKHKTIISGFKNYKLKKFIKENNFNNIINEKYETTNMVYSLFKLKNIKSNQIVVCYADIIFDRNIFNYFKNNKSLIILKKNWINVWRGRMKYKKILNDAEDVLVKKKKLISIGQKIKKKLPKFQYMGIIKLKYKDFINLKKYFRKIDCTKIDFTSFLNMALKNKIISLNTVITNKFWFEIDTKQDIDFASKKIW